MFEEDTLFLGAFFGSATGNAKCGGYARIPGDSILRTFGKDAYEDGFMQGEQYQFRVYNPKRGCYMLVSFQDSYTFGNSFYLDDSLLSVAPAKIFYPQTVSCRSKQDLIPVSNNNLYTWFSSTPYGLAMDSVTGTINTRNSKPGIYEVNITTESCLVNDKFAITITNGNEIFYSKDTTFCGPVQIGTYLYAKSYYWNTGDSVPFINVTKSGDFILEIEDTSGCFLKDTISINVINSNSNLLGEDTVVCSGSFTLNAPEGYTYEWNTKSKERSIVVNNSGAYWVTAEKQGCFFEDSIYIKLKEPVQFDLGGDTILLCRSPFILNGPPGYLYQWNTGETSESIQVDKSGRYSLHLIDEDGCNSNDSINVDFSKATDGPEINLGSDTIICALSSFTINAGKSGVEYTWNTGETGDFIEVQSSGLYTVSVKGQNGCLTFDSIAVEFRDGFAAGNISVDINNPPCSEEITLKVIPVSLHGTYPYTYELIKDGLIVSNSSDGIFNNIHEGIYHYEIRDAQGCKALKTNDIISVKKNEPCPEKVLAFTGAYQPSYFIGFPGTTKIYDMSGILIKTILTPAEWDGTGNNGEIVPMGDYIIVSGENQRIIVTVIK
ncbi:hypothetical protein MYP_2572 [Sporocytophaga myxococcoides]|uniref:Ig-like domain-containing protein n=2 Tax=Sporocytophaga myxococcoides TaxID=153721 RepID=A0A098LGY3_9BACT|nr:hypothetical protein MYP_2572 [Sporocytophaga myxococcoides]